MRPLTYLKVLPQEEEQEQQAGRKNGFMFIINKYNKLYRYTGI